MSSPAFREDTFSDVAAGSGVMTLEGTAFKGLVLTGIVIIAGTFAFDTCMKSLVEVKPEVIKQAGQLATLSYIPHNVAMMMVTWSIIGFVVGLFTIFVPRLSPFTSPVYATAEGFALGSISTLFQYMYPGVVPVAMAGTLGVLVVMLSLYWSGIIKVTEQLTAGIIAATGGICLVYIATIFLNMFGIRMPYLHETGWIGIGVSVAIVGIAAFNLLIDFDTIEKGVKQQAPKYMEWYSAFGLLVTIVWLYLEFLKLAAKVMANSSSSSSDD